MALKRLTIDGYGQLELNNVVFRRTGAIEAQCKLNEKEFADKRAENGMILEVDNIHRTINFPKEGSILPLAINYSTEHMYDEREPGLKNFSLGVKDFLPRLGYLNKGDKFTTNTIAYDDTEFVQGDIGVKNTVANVKNDPVYGVPCENGAIKLVKEEPKGEGLKLLVRYGTTMPDGQYAIAFQVL